MDRKKEILDTCKKKRRNKLDFLDYQNYINLLNTNLKARFLKHVYLFQMQAISNTNIDEIIVPFMDELVVIPKASSALAETSPPKYLIDTLFPHPHESEIDNTIKRRIATIYKISKDEVHFRFSRDEHFTAAQIGSLSSTKYDIIIRPRRLPVRYQFRALEMLAENDHVLQYLFPENNPMRAIKYEPEFE